MRSNRLLGSALIEHNLVKFEDLEAANERLLEIATTGDLRRSSVLSVLVYEKKVLTEEAMLHHVVDDHGVSVIDLRTYDVPETTAENLIWRLAGRRGASRLTMKKIFILWRRPII